jgi:hemoglobin
VTDAPEGQAPQLTPYERFAFYVRVARDPVLRPMYPDDDLGPAERRLRMFLEQYWGGPDTYQQERGHPRLRMRHAPFPVDALARDHWLANMHEAVTEQGMSEEDERELWQYLVRAAFAMQNIESPNPSTLTITEEPQ